MKTSRLIFSVPVLGALALTGCVANSPSDSANAANNITINSTDSECAVSQARAEAGNITFQITNGGPRTTEFYVLGADGVRIVAERENIAPGQTAPLTVSLQEGDYFTACKPGMTGANVGEASFTVAGGAAQAEGADTAQSDQVTTAYMDFVKTEVEALQPMVNDFAQAYMQGDDDTARDLYADARVHYERIEPVAEALGVLDPRIDYREIDYRAEAPLLEQDSPTFTQWLGFHRMEKDLWVPAQDQLQPDGTKAWDGWEPSIPEQRQVIGQTLIDDVALLRDEVNDPSFATNHQLSLASISNGASALLEEVAVTKATGEENWWSHRDLWDIQANVEGSRKAFELVAPIAESKGAEATAEMEQIRSEFDATQALLDKYGNLQDGFVTYDQITDSQRHELMAQIDALREPASKLTNAVLAEG
ncbi:iron uptake system protein EfeO [Corynebacterium lubricantis]|uniref:iron uptake system protein EfeO n=1 Tax=Corynebacterium lubricantis TaxID=541095 RepID=UPI00037C4155|nr:iron uptake system protein EfeO [Corynebacterium lubricantis]